MLYYTHEKNGGERMTDKVDRRAMRTKRNITDAFTQLLAEKDFDKITVAEIAERADINRRTFYLHYEDIYALLDELENTLVTEFKAELEQKQPTSLHAFLSDLVDFQWRSRQLVTALLANSASQFLAKIMQIAIDDDFAHSEYTTAIERQYCWNYIEHGLRGVLLDWLKTNSLPQEKIVNFITNTVQSSLRTAL
ncbi:hypothetical protein IV55_GL000242 [Furfurilactobacillus siliginis]|uniref:HTH tetR-type domain-containing protein n=2 Tax=Furfurilactobacillus siliginis TaxID=348151 RepID=A0A0R2L6T6_9LACO|nr:hypothetical protein IV55_GL000242 [Furfurilactobacillus siliginis]